MASPLATPPLTDAIIISVSRLVDDAQVETREPSHSDLEFEINRIGLASADPKGKGQPLGKAKRVRATLSWAMENAPEKGAAFVGALIAHLRGCGGFRQTSPNFVGEEAIRNVADAMRLEGFDLSSDGQITPLLLDNLAGVHVTAALEGYVRRAKKGADDAALVAGTGKDLLEATAAHVLVEKWGTYSTSANFPSLLGQAFVALGFATPQDPVQPHEAAHRSIERALYQMGCAVNTLRNKEGTGHGRPWLPSVTPSQAKLAVHQMASIAEYMLTALKQPP